MADYYKKITAEKSRFDLRLKELWRYRDLIGLFTKRHFILMYKQTILGPAWAIINPLMSSLLYMLVFGNIAKLSTEGVPQLLFYLTGTAVWTLFSQCVTQNADTFRVNAHVFGKVYFPRLTVPVSNVLCALMQFGIQFVLILGLCIYYCAIGMVNPNWYMMPVLLLLLVEISAMGMGFGIIISAMTTKYRDLSILVTYGVSLWMYASPVVYPVSSIENSALKTAIWLNPVSAPIEAVRRIILGQGTVGLASIGYSVVCTIIVVALGMAVFNRVEKNFMDTI